MTDDLRKKRPIDDVFWKAWIACEPELLRYAFRFTRDIQRALDLRDKAFDAIINGVRPWREGTELVDHGKGCIKSISSHDTRRIVLRKHEYDEDPDAEAPTRTPLEEAMDNEKSAAMREVGRELCKRSRPGSLESRFLEERAKGVEDLHDIADHLDVTYRQVLDCQKGVRRKSKELLRERGFTLDENEDDDGEES